MEISWTSNYFVFDFQLDVETEEYFAISVEKSKDDSREESDDESPEKSMEKSIHKARQRLANFKFNVNLTWRAIELLDDTQVRLWYMATDFVCTIISNKTG